MSDKTTATISSRAMAIAEAGGLDAAIAAGAVPVPLTLSLVEGVVLGLLRQGVSTYLAIFGHGSTALAEVLRIYETHGLVRCFQFRNEIEMSHAATALRWAYGIASAVVTSIGPGALQAMTASLAASSNGIGVYHIYGDQTTHGEGYNMQQVPKRQSGIYGQITALMGASYTLHTPEALREAMRRGKSQVFHPTKAGPFYLLLPINTQPQNFTLNLASLPGPEMARPGSAAADAVMEAARIIAAVERPVIKAGGGTRNFASALTAFAERAQVPVVLSPGSTGVLANAHALNMHVGGSKGSISGNHAMAEADLLVAIGSRAVCQSDCSGLGYPKVRHVINLNADLDDATHYQNTLPLLGDIGATLSALLAVNLEEPPAARRSWLEDCAAKKREWLAFRDSRTAAPPLVDEAWKQPVLTQPAAIGIAAAFCKRHGLLKLFDAGDVQANGFQIVEDDSPHDTITESGASYMGFAVSALMAAALTPKPRYAVAFSGDGSFMMSPQVLIDAVQHGVRGMIVLFDNRRMAAISGLQMAQYGIDSRTSDQVEVNYVALAQAVKGVKALWGGTTGEQLGAALEEAIAYDGLSLVHVPVYHGDDPMGSMGAYGRWNVGNWCADAQKDYVLFGI